MKKGLLAYKESTNQVSPIYTIGSGEIVDNLIIPVTVKNFNGIYGFQFEITFDPEILECVDCVFETDLPKLYGYRIKETNTIRLMGIWIPNANNPHTGVTLPDDSVLLNIHFKRVGEGVSSIDFQDTPMSATDSRCMTINPASEALLDDPFATYYKSGLITTGVIPMDNCEMYKLFYDYFNETE